MRNWKMIPDGDVFESLVGSLLMAEIPGVVVYGRPGPDSDIDSVSFDHTHVYQAKFHGDGKMDSAIGSAKDELKKIVEYRKPEHRNFKFWKDVTAWSLVGNSPTNRTDEAKWSEQIVPRFEELSRLAMLGAYGKANEVTKATLRMICDRCMMLNYDDRTYVYHYMMPDEHGASWCGDKVPGRYLDARKSAQALFDDEPEDSSLRDFYKYCVDRASGTVKMISDNIESWRHE